MEFKKSAGATEHVCDLFHRDIYLEMAGIQICGISVGLFKHMNLLFDSL